jgi:hypothetical protein
MKQSKRRRQREGLVTQIKDLKEKLSQAGGGGIMKTRREEQYKKLIEEMKALN